MAKETAKMAPLFKALSDGNRLKILQFVRAGDYRCDAKKGGQCKDRTCLKDLTAKLKIGFPTVSHHVKELTRAGILTTEKEGRWSRLRVNTKRLAEMADFLNEFLI